MNIKRIQKYIISEFLKIHKETLPEYSPLGQKLRWDFEVVCRGKHEQQKERNKIIWISDDVYRECINTSLKLCVGYTDKSVRYWCKCYKCGSEFEYEERQIQTSNKYIIYQDMDYYVNVTQKAPVHMIDNKVYKYNTEEKRLEQMGLIWSLG